MRIFFLVLITLSFIFHANASTPIKGDELFTGSTNSYVQLSPNGGLLSFLQNTEDNRYLILFDTAKDEVRTSLQIGLRSQLRNYYWLNDEVLLIDLLRDGNNILLTGILEGKKVNLKAHDFYGDVINLLPDQPDKLLFSLHKKNGRYRDLLLVNLEDFMQGNFEQAQETEFGVREVRSFNYDHVSKKLFLSTYDSEDEIAHFYWQELGTEKAHKFLELTDFGDYFEAVHFLDDNRLAVLTNRDTDKIVLQEYYMDTGKLGEVIYAHDMYDLVRATYDSNNQLFSVGYYEHGIYQRTFFQKSTSRFAKRLQKTFPDHGVFITDASAEAKNIVLVVSGADEPGTYYLYSEATDTARILMSRHPQLDNISLFKNQKMRINLNEEVTLEAYLTLPDSPQLSTLIVYPHGGPIGVRETDYYTPEVQYLVSRGFTVLRVNFRGSSGFGKAFREQGVGQFGKRIEQDIMKAVNQVLENHSFENVCAMGSSYGGYSSAMLAIKHPDLFKCVVASFGIYDLPLLFNESNLKMHEDSLESISNVVGEFSEDMKDYSPLYLADQLKAPILLIAGRRDSTAGFEHSNRFKYVLEKLGHQVETMFYEDTGHGHNNWSYDRHEAAVTFDFLVRVLDLDTTPLTRSSEGQKALADDYLIISDKFEFEDKVPNDEQRAFEYLQKAANLNAPRAVFNIGAEYHTGDHFDKNMEEALSHYKKAGELGYEGAFLRLGTLYMQGYQVPQSWELAQDFLHKAVDKKDDIQERFRLARFYCIVPGETQDVDKCLHYFDTTDFKERNQAARRFALGQLNNNLSWAITDGRYSNDDLLKLQGIIEKEFDLTHIKGTLEDVEAGVFTLIEGEDFLEKNEFEYQEDASLVNILPNENTRIGVRFDVDVEGLDANTDRTGIVIRWFKQVANGPKIPIDNSLLHGSPRNTWYSFREVAHYEQTTTMTMQLYDLEQQLLLEREFIIEGSGDEEIADNEVASVK